MTNTSWARKIIFKTVIGVSALSVGYVGAWMLFGAPPRVIALCGPAGSGKDWIGIQLRQNYGYQRLAFGDPLKRAVSVKTGIDRSYFENPQTKDTSVTVQVDHIPTSSTGVAKLDEAECKMYHTTTYRQLLIDHAAKARAKDDLVFVKPIMNEMECMLCDSKPPSLSMFHVGEAQARVSVTDLRFQVEKKAIKAKFPDALCLWVDRPNNTKANIQDNTQLRPEDCDGRITNNGQDTNFPPIWFQIRTCQLQMALKREWQRVQSLFAKENL